MKTTIKILCFLALLIPPSAFSDPVYSLQAAVTSKLVSASIHGVGGDKSDYFGRHYGKSIIIELKNLTSQNLDIEVETGRKLKCSADTIQNMMITHGHFFALAPYGSYSDTLYAMCIQEHNHGPKYSYYKIDNMADNYLLELAKLIMNKDYQDASAQSAVWVLTDNASITGIYSLDTSEANTLRRFTAMATSQPFKPGNFGGLYDNFIETPQYFITGTIKWKMENDGYASLYVYDDKGNYITTVFEKRLYDAGNRNCDFKVSSCLIKPNAKYLVRLKIKDYTTEELVCMANY